MTGLDTPLKEGATVEDAAERPALGEETDGHLREVVVDHVIGLEVQGRGHGLGAETDLDPGQGQRVGLFSCMEFLSHNLQFGIFILSKIMRRKA